MTITLHAIDEDNWYQAASLQVREDQRTFVAPNWYSLLEAVYSDGEIYSRGICDGAVMVGYAMLEHDAETQRCCIVRLMIDAQHQGKGYGRAALRLCIADLQARYHPPAIYLSFEPQNIPARTLYESVGFVDTGEIDEGELVFCLVLDPYTPA